jgi:hypothetical protein
MAAANRDAVTQPAATRGELSDEKWVDVNRAVRIVRRGGVEMRVHGVEIFRKLKQQRKAPEKRSVHGEPKKGQKEKSGSSAGGSDAAAVQSLNAKQRKSAQRLQVYQEKKRAALLAQYGKNGTARFERIFQAKKRKEKRAAARAKLRDVFWRAWASWKPIFGGTVLYYTSLREQYVYKRAAKLYNAAFKSDPGKSGRTLARWLRRGAAAPMDDDRGVKRAAVDVNAEAAPLAEAAPKRRGVGCEARPPSSACATLQGRAPASGQPIEAAARASRVGASGPT